MSDDRTGTAAPLRPSDPVRLGAYRLLGRLGEGGMGTVFLARGPAGDLVAVKMVRVDLASDDEFRRRFRSEVDRARQVPPFARPRCSTPTPTTTTRTSSSSTSTAPRSRT